MRQLWLWLFPKKRLFAVALGSNRRTCIMHDAGYVEKAYKRATEVVNVQRYGYIL